MEAYTRPAKIHHAQGQEDDYMFWILLRLLLSLRVFCSPPLLLTRLCVPAVDNTSHTAPWTQEERAIHVWRVKTPACSNARSLARPRGRPLQGLATRDISTREVHLLKHRRCKRRRRKDTLLPSRKTPIRLTLPPPRNSTPRTTSRTSSCRRRHKGLPVFRTTRHKNSSKRSRLDISLARCSAWCVRAIR